LQFLLENGKKRTFSYKIACKKFSWSGQRGASHRAINTPLAVIANDGRKTRSGMSEFLSIVLSAFARSGVTS